VRGRGRGDVLAELLDLLNLAGKLGGEGLLERLRWTSAKMSGGQRGCAAGVHGGGEDGGEDDEEGGDEGEEEGDSDGEDGPGSCQSSSSGGR
jgi:hypothetical protein